MNVRSEGFTRLIDQTVGLLAQESGPVGRFLVVGRLAQMEPSGRAIVISDLHGDLESLLHIMKDSQFIEDTANLDETILIFLGDYGDRGEYSVEVYYTVLKLKLLFPENVILMRGNHEGPEDLSVSPYDLPAQLHARFGNEWEDPHLKIRGLFNFLYNAALVKGQYMIVHGGPPHQARTIGDLAHAHTKHPQQRLLEEMLWNDPIETISGVCESPRGAGRLFGERITNEALKRFNAKILIRGHEHCQDGFKINHHSKVLTIFSRKGPPYFNSQGAYLDIKFRREFRDAKGLVPYIRKF